MAAANGEKFKRLYSGNFSDYNSQSEADMALVAMLAYWTGPDASRRASVSRSQP